MLSPPRSFSSVVSTVIGQHPELYGFPELHLFIGDTVQEVIDLEHKKGNYFGPPGVLRTIAELVYGSQTQATVTKATGWLLERRHWSTKRMTDYFLELVDPLIGIEKSPVTCLKPLWIERAYALYPKAHFLHLTRHPISSRKSMDEFFMSRKIRMHREDEEARTDRLFDWYRMHKNIIDFTKTLPLGQTMRVKGEDVLSEPELYLPQISEWLGIRTDREAVQAMLRPEQSPYAYPGPASARGGNDPKFMRDPCLRVGRVREPNLKESLARNSFAWFSDQATQDLYEDGFMVASDREIEDEITGLSQSLGYL